MLSIYLLIFLLFLRLERLGETAEMPAPSPLPPNGSMAYLEVMVRGRLAGVNRRLHHRQQWSRMAYYSALFTFRKRDFVLVGERVFSMAI